MTIDDVAEHFSRQWDAKTLHDLHMQAQREETGIAFDAVRAPGKPSLFIVLCMTRPDQIEAVESRLDFVDDGILEDWKTLTLAMVAVRARRVGSLVFESLRDANGKRSAVALIAADPDSVKTVETLVKMP